MRLRTNKIFWLILLIFSSLITGLQAQEKIDSLITTGKVKPQVLTPFHRNVIKINPSPMVVGGFDIRNISITYERLLNKTTSVSLQVGYLVYPTIINGKVIDLIDIHRGKKNGINVSLDFRYYPYQRNRRPAPDGLYLGGYLSYYGFQFKNQFDILHTSLDQNGQIRGKLAIVNLGFELGYQFIFWKRFSLDLLLLGISASNYYRGLTIGGNIDPNAIDDINSELGERLMSYYPLLRTIFSGAELTKSRSNSTLLFGIRSCLQLGIHF